VEAIRPLKDIPLLVLPRANALKVSWIAPHPASQANRPALITDRPINGPPIARLIATGRITTTTTALTPGANDENGPT